MKNYPVRTYSCLHWLGLVLCFLCSLPLAAATFQTDPQVDSILKASVKIIYENPDEAISTGTKVYEEEAYSVDIRIRGLLLVSTAYSSKRDYQKALQFTLKAHEMVQGTTNELLQIQILTKLGNMYEQLKIYDKAIEYLEASEKRCLAYPHKDSIRFTLASNYFVKGFIYKERLNCEIAIDFFKKGIAQYKSLSKVNTLANASIAQYNLGNCYIMLNDYELAKTSFEASIHNAILAKAYSLHAFSQKGLAEVYTLQGNYSLAVMMLQQAKEISKEVGDLVLNLEIYKGLSENYLALNDWENYKIYRNKYLETQLKVKQSERSSVDDSLVKLQENTTEQTTYFKQRFLTVLQIFSLVVLVVFGIVIIKLRQDFKKKKALQQRLKALQEEKITIS